MLEGGWPPNDPDADYVRLSRSIPSCSGAMRHREDGEAIPTIKSFTTAQLDLALGRSNVVHAALLAGPANDTVLARLARLERFRSGLPGDSGGNGVRN